MARLRCHTTHGLLLVHDEIHATALTTTTLAINTTSDTDDEPGSNRDYTSEEDDSGQRDVAVQRGVAVTDR